jgi:ribokinase
MVNITVVGSFVVGITVRVPRPPVLGESLIGDLFDTGPGGKGTNQAIAASRLGANVNLIALVGDDIFAEMAHKVFNAEGIGTDNIYQEKDINTGVGLVTLLESGDNSIICHLGANTHLRPEHVDRAEDVIAKSDIILTQFEIPTDSVARAMQLGRKHGAMTIWNPAPAKWVPPEFLTNIDLITPNETEARILLGLEPDDEISLDDLAEGITQLGVQSVVITMGKQGCFVITDGVRQVIPAPEVAEVDPTGAGDAFNAALAVGLGRGLSISDAARQANYAGAYSTRYLGVIDGLPTKTQLEDFKDSRS